MKHTLKTFPNHHIYEYDDKEIIIQAYRELIKWESDFERELRLLEKHIVRNDAEVSNYNAGQLAMIRELLGDAE